MGTQPVAVTETALFNGTLFVVEPTRAHLCLFLALPPGGKGAAGIAVNGSFAYY